MNVKAIICGLLATTAFGAGAATVVASGNEKAQSASAVTETTVYYAVPSATVGSYTVKLNANIGDNNTWKQSDMTKTDKTYQGYDIYVGSFSAKYDGVDALQIQLYDGGTWKSQKQPYSSWTTSATFNGKMFVHNSNSWVSYAYDVQKTIYLNTYDWGSLYVHYWSTGVSDTSWPGNNVSFTDANLRFNGENNKLQAYTITCLNTASPKFLYQSAADVNKSDDLNVTDGSYYWHNGSAWVEETGDLAAAAKYVWDFNTARLAVPAAGSVKSYSICGMDLSSWYAKYNALSSGAKAKVDAASILTYKDKDSTGADTRVSFEAIVDYMEEELSSGAKNFIRLNDSNTYVFMGVIGAISIISVIGLALYVSKKRKLAR